MHTLSLHDALPIFLFMGYEANRMSNRSRGYSLQPLRAQAARGAGQRSIDKEEL
jgi:hypothetical protein